MDRVSDGHTEFNYRDHNILIVDDTPVNLGVTVEFLQRYGFGIRIARSGETALRRVQYDPPDIVLLDVLMPGIDGFETCRRLKAGTATRDIPVIFMTSLASVEDKVKAFEAGAVDYVTKPLDQNEVLARVITHLRLAGLAKSLRRRNEQLEVTGQAEKTRLFDAINQQREQLRRLNARLTEMQENERRQLARELHDELGQALTAISINLAAINHDLPAGSSSALKQRLEDAIHLANEALEQIREMSLNLRPPMLDDLGLVPTLRWYIKRYADRLAVPVELEIAGVEQRLRPELETVLYRVIQEGLTNIARHAHATAVHISLSRTTDQIQALIQDNGDGFEPETVLMRRHDTQGAGLLGIRERVALAGGVFDIHAAPGAGTRLLVRLPV